MFLCSVSLQAQDSLDIEQAVAAAQDKNSALKLADLVFKLANSEPEKALMLSRKLIQIAEEKDWPELKMEGLFGLADALSSKGQYVESNQHLEAMHRLATYHRDRPRMVKAEVSLGLNYFMLGSLPASLRYYRDALEKIKPGTNEDEQIIYLNVGNIYSELKLHKDAISTYKQCLDFAKKSGNKEMEAIVLGNLAEELLEADDLLAVDSLINRSLILSEELDDQLGVGFAYKTLGYIYLKFNQYEKANFYARQSMAIFEELESNHFLIDPYIILARVNKANMKTNEALGFANKAHQLARQVKATHDLISTHKLLAEIYYEINQPAKAFANQKRAYFIQDSLSSIQVSQLLSDFENYKAMAAEKDNAEKLKLENNYQKRFTFIIVAICLVLLSGFIFLAILSHRLKLLNTQLKQQTAQLEKSDRFKNKLIAVLSHDLRSPLASLGSLIEMFDEELLQSGQWPRMKEQLKQRFLSTNALFANVLTWVKSQIEGENYRPQFVSLHSVVNDVMLQTSEQSREKNLTVVNEMAPDVQVYADPDQLKVIFRNLISNAVKYSFSGGAVRIESSVGTDFQVVAVHDKGKGIDEATGLRLFSEIKSQATGTSGEGGSGLGLIICKEMVEKAGGRIWFESNGKGTSFYVSLPIHPNGKS